MFLCCCVSSGHSTESGLKVNQFCRLRKVVVYHAPSNYALKTRMKLVESNCHVQSNLKPFTLTKKNNSISLKAYLKGCLPNPSIQKPQLNPPWGEHKTFPARQQRAKNRLLPCIMQAGKLPRSGILFTRF